MRFDVSAIGWEDTKRLLEQLEQVVEPIKWHKLWGVRVRDAARMSARQKGGRSFWRQISDSVQLGEVSRAGAIVYSDHVAAGQKERGGVIKAGRTAQWLTIPITAEAKRKRAGEFELGGRKLFVITSKKGNRILAYDNAGELVPLYVLKRSVFQNAEPFFPSNAEIGAIGLQEGLRLLEGAR